MKSIAIMQPTYLPWIGYLAMVDRVDEFVFLDSVQFARRSWQQRNKIRNSNGQELMLTIPVEKRGLRDQRIDEAHIQYGPDFPEGHIRAITANYGRSPHFSRYAPELFDLLRAETAGLADLTIALTRWLMTAFGIATPTLRSRDIPAGGQKAELLADLCLRRDAGHYVSAPGSQGYLNESDAMQRRGIAISYHHYRHPEYAQGKQPFLSHLGAIDLLFHCGGSDGLVILRSGVTEAAPT